MTKKKKDTENERQLFAWLSVFFTIIGFIVALALRKNDKYIMYYAKHGLVLFIGFLIAGFLSWISVLGRLLEIFVVVLWIISWVNALSGKKKKTFIVSEISEKIEI